MNTDALAVRDAAARVNASIPWKRCVGALRRAMLFQPRPLAEISWPLVGGTIGVAFALVFPDLPQRLIYGDEWRDVPIYTFIRILEGLTILFTGALLLHVHAAPWWRLLAPAIAVLLGSLAGGALEVLIIDPAADAYGIPALPVMIAWLYRSRSSLEQWSLVAAAWYLADRARRRAAMLREEEVERQRLATRMSEARLQMLEAQVEPHFVFNTLANIKRLCREDPTLARKTVDRFATYVHASLPHMRGTGGTIGRELDLALAYLDVQKVRMGRRLDYAIDVEPALRAQPFPRLMLISLVENAIKHGLNPSAEGGAIRISAVLERDLLRVSVADTGQGFTKTMGSGVGLSNIRSRLSATHGQKARLVLLVNQPRGVVATIELPLPEAAARRAAPQHGAA